MCTQNQEIGYTFFLYVPEMFKKGYIALDDHFRALGEEFYSLYQFLQPSVSSSSSLPSASWKPERSPPNSPAQMKTFPPPSPSATP